MSYEIPGFSFTLTAKDDFSNGVGQFRFVKVDPATGGAVKAGDGDNIAGVRQNTPAVGQATTVVGSGIVWVEAGDELAIGDIVTADADGRAVAATAGGAAHGQVFRPAGAAGEVASVYLNISYAV